MRAISNFNRQSKQSPWKAIPLPHVSHLQLNVSPFWLPTLDPCVTLKWVSYNTGNPTGQHTYLQSGGTSLRNPIVWCLIGMQPYMLSSLKTQGIRYKLVCNVLSFLLWLTAETERGQRLPDVDAAQQLKLRERQRFFEEVFQHDVDVYLSSAHLCIRDYKRRELDLGHCCKPIHMHALMHVHIQMHIISLLLLCCSSNW